MPTGSSRLNFPSSAAIPINNPTILFATEKEIHEHEIRKAVEKWGEITEDEMDVIAGKKDQLVGKIQARYGMSKEEAEKEVKDFSNDCNC